VESGVAVDVPPCVVGVPRGVVDCPVVAVPFAEVVPVLPGVWVCCVDTASCVDGVGSSREGGNTSVLDRLGVVGPLGLGVSAGAPLPTLPPVDVVDPEVDDPDEVWASAPTVVKLSANIANNTALMIAPFDGNAAIVASFRQG
jgi:hypothetical protein